jgi:hypothetical protein
LEVVEVDMSLLGRGEVSLWLAPAEDPELLALAGSFGLDVDFQGEGLRY